MEYQLRCSLDKVVLSCFAVLLDVFEIIVVSFFVDNIYQNILGHKDLDCTDCPGKNLYSKIEDIRVTAQAEYGSLGGLTEPIARATLVGQSDQPTEVNAGQEKEVWVDFRNDGNFTWRNYTQNTLQVLARNPSSNLYVAGWNSPKQVARLTTANVAPGEIGRFGTRRLRIGALRPIPIRGRG